MNSAWSERLAVVFSFILIFAFNSIDNAISPMVGPISHHFGVAEARALWFISFCSGGTVVGLFFGPALLQAVPAKRCLLYVVGLLALSQVLFALSSNFALANFFRLLSGFGAGLVASVMWQLTFHGVSKAYFPAMIAVLMSARPLATALGVPMAGLLAFNFSWQLPIWVIAGLTALSGILLYQLYPQHAATVDAESPEKAASTTATQPQSTATTSSDNGTESPDSAADNATPTPPNSASEPETAPKGALSFLRQIVRPYGTALAAPFAYPYYLGTTINRMAYFGFYSFCGLWFAAHYGLDLKDISYALLVIGLTEALINFSTNRIIGWIGHKMTFLGSLLLSAAILPFFIFGKMDLYSAVALIAVFMLLDRIYSMALVISVPKMFPIKGDMTAFGSLNTLTAWGAMCLIAWLQGWLGQYGLVYLEAMIIGCFLVGGAALIYVQKKTKLI